MGSARAQIQFGEQAPRDDMAWRPVQRLAKQVFRRIVHRRARLDGGGNHQARDVLRVDFPHLLDRASRRVVSPLLQGKQRFPVRKPRVGQRELACILDVPGRAIECPVADEEREQGVPGRASFGPCPEHCLQRQHCIVRLALGERELGLEGQRIGLHRPACQDGIDQRGSSSSITFDGDDPRHANARRVVVRLRRERAIEGGACLRWPAEGEIRAAERALNFGYTRRVRNRLVGQLGLESIPAARLCQGPRECRIETLGRSAEFEGSRQLSLGAIGVAEFEERDSQQVTGVGVLRPLLQRILRFNRRGLVVGAVEVLTRRRDVAFRGLLAGNKESQGQATCEAYSGAPNPTGGQQVRRLTRRTVRQVARVSRRARFSDRSGSSSRRAWVG